MEIDRDMQPKVTEPPSEDQKAWYKAGWVDKFLQLDQGVEKLMGGKIGVKRSWRLAP
jgi:hypothetical protein